MLPLQILFLQNWDAPNNFLVVRASCPREPPKIPQNKIDRLLQAIAYYCHNTNQATP
ncbi:MAG: hypothetical protein KME23_08695 [Goleter apudmare HA4340-LM2]|nr:hypothetical protein [Goleter apudmare HA4340-LM2]